MVRWLVVAALLVAMPAVAQDRYSDLTLHLGSNGASGALGLSYAYRFAPQWAGEVDFGLAAVGLRGGIGGRYFFSPKLDAGFASLSYAYATGLFGGSAAFPVQTESGAEVTRSFVLPPAHLVNVTIGYRWSFASDRGHFTLAGGYAVRLAGGRFAQVGTPEKLNEATELAFDLLEPGGVILDLGIGLSF